MSQLDEVLNVLVELEPCVVGIRGTEVLVKHADDVRAAVHLLEGQGFDAVGIVSGGNTFDVETGEPRGRIHITLLVDKAGNVASRMLMPDGIVTDAPEGELLDELKAALAA